MNWNFTAGDCWCLRFVKQDVEALMGLLRRKAPARIWRAWLTEVHRAWSDGWLSVWPCVLRAREAAFWLVEKDGQLLGRIGSQRIQLDATQRPAAMFTPALDLLPAASLRCCAFA